ncbi:TetR family transcriptional regulator [Nonomuraea sp. NPDC049750]|uniref:TetR/AcrR family transcriptional regulator n=1 Tax=Nonomuraea sp. NPDC049750 TaxID=3154738 RepID=UPI0033D16791
MRGTSRESGRSASSRRDPSGRRRAIVEAAAGLIAGEGVSGLTHRKVAAAAEVPLGSTTYYFTDLADLVQAALEHIAALSRQGLEEMARDLREATDLAAALAELTTAYLAEPQRHRIQDELYLAASHRPELRPAARLWFDGLTDLLAPRTGQATAQAIAAFIDGVLLHALIHDRPLDTSTLTTALSALIGTSDHAPR